MYLTPFPATCEIQLHFQFGGRGSRELYVSYRYIFLCLHFLCTEWLAHSAVIGQLTLKDGSLLHGEIIEMVDGTLKAKAAFSPGDPIPIAWSEITGLATEGMITIV